jgi:hypothetical protein
MLERRKIASLVHTWRAKVQADTLLLAQRPVHFDWFAKQLVLRPLLLTPDGDMVVLLKVWLVLVLIAMRHARGLVTAQQLTAAHAAAAHAATALQAEHAGHDAPRDVWCWAAP